MYDQARSDQNIAPKMCDQGGGNVWLQSLQKRNFNCLHSLLSTFTTQELAYLDYL